MGQIVEAYLEDRKAKPGISSMRFCWNNSKKHFGNLLPEHITRDVCRAYIASRPAAAPETLRKELGVVRAAINWKLPQALAVFELPPAPQARENHLTREQYKKLIEACTLHRIRLFVMLALATAGRKTAILELTWDRVDFERGLITLSKGDAQTNKGRATVPMTDSLRAALIEAQKVALSPYVIEYAGGPVKKIDKGFREAARRAELDVTPHDIRRSAAIWMAEARVPMSEISAFLGHKNSRITERNYARYSPDYLRAASKALEI